MLFTIQDQTLHGYDLDTGKPLDNISALTEQIQSDEQDVNWTTTSSFPLMFLKGDEDNSLFYIDHTGVYRYVLGGSTVEQDNRWFLEFAQFTGYRNCSMGGRTAMETSMWAAMQEKI